MHNDEEARVGNGPNAILGKLLGTVVVCVGWGPLTKEEMEAKILAENGIKGGIDIWQASQLVIIGRNDVDFDYLDRTAYVFRNLHIGCRYMTQEDFIERLSQVNDENLIFQTWHPGDHEGMRHVFKIFDGWLPSPWSFRHLNSKTSKSDVEQLDWEILPPGEHPFPRILAHFHTLGFNRKKKIDEYRLKFIDKLEPDVVYIGQGELAEYAMFHFSRVNKAVLECPIYGNAIYILDGDDDWKYLSGFTKAELFAYYRHRFVRITHKGDWESRLCSELEIWPDDW